MPLSYWFHSGKAFWLSPSVLSEGKFNFCRFSCRRQMSTATLECVRFGHICVNCVLPYCRVQALQKYSIANLSRIFVETEIAYRSTSHSVRLGAIICDNFIGKRQDGGPESPLAKGNQHKI